MQRAGVVVTPAPWQSDFYHEHDVIRRAVSQRVGHEAIMHMEFNRHNVMIRNWWTKGETLPEVTRARLCEARGEAVHIDANGDLLEI